jgi:hypothetical protein
MKVAKLIPLQQDLLSKLHENALPMGELFTLTL